MFATIAPKSSSGRNPEVTAHIDDISTIFIPLKLRNQRQRVKHKFPGTLPLTINYFRYFDANNREELARMIAVEHLPFNFGENVDFVNYCQKALNPSACRVPRTTLTRTLFNLYKKVKKN